MSHWSERYLGKKYDVDTYDCLDFVLEVLKREYGLRTHMIPNHGCTTLEQQRELAARLDHYAVQIDEPEDGCGVLMRQGDRLRHLGILYKKRLVNYVIHNSPRAKGVVQTQDYRLINQGYTIDRYLKWLKK